MKAVILAGGLGTRISEETHLKPKPMIEIGGRPILWHILKLHSGHGIHDFVICCGYKGYVVKEYFANYFLHMSDVTFDMRTNEMHVLQRNAEPWTVTLVDTGDETQTGGRLRRVAEHIKDERDFCFTYGDGLSDVDLSKEIEFHRSHGKLATVLAVEPPGRYGALERDGGRVTGFREKPSGDGGLINGGFFVLSPRCLDFVAGDATSWEAHALPELARRGQLMSWEHQGFWQAMDTLRDKSLLEDSMVLGSCPMEKGVDLSPAFWRGRRVLVTGHTGFKGGWLSLWLARLGAEVHGFALPPPTEPNFHDVCGVNRLLVSSTLGDIVEFDLVADTLRRARPEIILHLAAQPLVRYSYDSPLETFRVNVMGTLNLLEAARHTPGVQAVINVTTDKCYENREWLWPYREDEAMGGRDPYSASKGCSELATAAYRRSFLGPAGVRLATARAGNVIGGGDWARDRLVPDIFRALDDGKTVAIRSPQAVRPWQHVLEPLSGYLLLAEKLVTEGERFAEAWNFGPADDGWPVQAIVERICGQSPGASWSSDQSASRHEAQMLRLDSSKARTMLGWRPRWTVGAALDRTIGWHNAWRSRQPMAEVSLAQIADYEATPAS